MTKQFLTFIDFLGSGVIPAKAGIQCVRIVFKLETSHRGLVQSLGKRSRVKPPEVRIFSSPLMKIVILDNLRSVHNVGSIFRTANACGIEKIFLCGITPTPLDKKGNKRSDFAKVALGAEESIEWEYVEDTLTLVKKLKEEGCYVIAIEQDEKAIDYKEINLSRTFLDRGTVFILGPEVDGIKKEILDECDMIAEIPMLGTKESLNVTIAFGIALYRILGI